MLIMLHCSICHGLLRVLPCSHMKKGATSVPTLSAFVMHLVSHAEEPTSSTLLVALLDS
jgi:hypothetical protein